MGSSFVPVADIVKGSIRYLEFTFVEAIMGTKAKTGKEVVKAYNLKYEKMDDEQSILRANTLIKKQKEEAKQAEKAETTRIRDADQAGFSGEALEGRAAAKERRKKVRVQAEAQKGGSL